MNHTLIKEFIKKSYSTEESEKYIDDELDQQQLETVKRCGLEVLKYVPPMSFACAYMSAIWVELARKEGLNAYMVAGKLDLHGRRIFDYEDSIEKNETVQNWNGHCWAIFNGTIGDASFFRTAYSNTSPAWLTKMVQQSFGQGRGMVIGSHADMGKMGLQYSPHYVFTDYQLDGILNALSVILKNHYQF